MIDPLQVLLVLWNALYWYAAGAAGFIALVYLIGWIVGRWVDRASDDLERPIW